MIRDLSIRERWFVLACTLAFAVLFAAPLGFPEPPRILVFRSPPLGTVRTTEVIDVDPATGLESIRYTDYGADGSQTGSWLAPSQPRPTPLGILGSLLPAACLGAAVGFVVGIGVAPLVGFEPRRPDRHPV